MGTPTPGLGKDHSFPFWELGINNLNNKHIDDSQEKTLRTGIWDSGVFHHNQETAKDTHIPKTFNHKSKIQIL